MDVKTFISDQNINIMADNGKIIVGQINISKEFFHRRINDKDYTCWYFNRLFVSNEFRNRGYAKLLLSELIKILNQKQIILWLDINPYGDLNYEQLEKLYMKYGFKKQDFGYIWMP